MKNKDDSLNPKELEKWLTSDQAPENLSEIVLSKLSEDLKEVAHVGKLKKKAQSKKELEKLMQSTKLSKKEIEKRIALHDLVLEHKETFLKILEAEKKSSKVRASGHYWDNKLTYSSPQKNKQMTLFEILENPSTKKKIEKVDYKVSAVGIQLNPAENKLMTALTKLLHDKSEHHNPTSDKFYGGNHNPLSMKKYGGLEKNAQAPVLKIRPSELYKAYLDSSEYSGAEIKVVKKLIDSLSNKKFILRYERKKIVEKNGKKERLTDLIEDFQPLIHILRHIPDLTDAELANFKKGQTNLIEKKGEYIIALNPVMVDQIATKYVEFPRDIEMRTAEAAGGPRRVTESDIALRDYMLRELSNKRFRCEVNDEKLPFILKLDGYIRNRKRSMIRKRIAQAVDVSKDLGLIQSHEIEVGKKGQSKWIFHLNPEFG